MTILIWAMAICSGLMAGLYATFSVVIMPSLALLEPARGIDAMNSINRQIVRTSFMPLFFGSTVIALLMIVAGVWHLGEPGSMKALVGGLVYCLGMFLVTAAFNVPLNNQLDVVSGNSEAAQSTWHHYLRRWTPWNTLRAVACLITLVISIDLLG